MCQWKQKRYLCAHTESAVFYTHCKAYLDKQKTYIEDRMQSPKPKVCAPFENQSSEQGVRDTNVETQPVGSVCRSCAESQKTKRRPSWREDISLR